MAAHTLSFLLPIFLLLTFTPLTISLSEACNAVDKEALLHFKSKIISDPSELLQSWKPSSDCCQGWKGITCDSSTGRVMILSLTLPNIPTDTYISGTLSPYLGNLTNLQVLTLIGFEKMKGPIPLELSKLSKLETLYLDYNHLSGDLHSFLVESLKSLSELSLSGNYLSGTIPASIGSLRFLTRLDLHQNKFHGGIPASIGNLTKLEHLDLSRNRLSGRIPPSLARIGKSAFEGNAGLCGSPLPPCKHF